MPNEVLWGLCVVGSRPAVMRFARKVGLKRGSTEATDFFRSVGELAGGNPVLVSGYDFRAEARSDEDAVSSIICTFTTSWREEPAELIRALSIALPDLSFVLGWTDTNDDCGSYAMAAGRQHIYRMPERRQEAIVDAALRANGLTADDLDNGYTDGDYDPVLWALIEADWEKRDAAVRHWAGWARRRIRKPQ